MHVYGMLKIWKIEKKKKKARCNGMQIVYDLNAFGNKTNSDESRFISKRDVIKERDLLISIQSENVTRARRVK